VEEREERCGREKEAERRARQQARDLLLNARDGGRAAIRELREAADCGAGAGRGGPGARRRVEERARREAERTPVDGSAPARPALRCAEGAHVRIDRQRAAEGMVVELRDDRATVEVGGLRMQVPVRGWKPSEGRRSRKAAAAPREAGALPDAACVVGGGPAGHARRGGAGQLVPALDAAIQADLPSLRIIHGKGTGALREVVTELLKMDGRVRSFRPAAWARAARA
jgi:DNA mismatch repair protein MutS2